MRIFLPDDFKNKANDAARKILELHKQMIGKTELDAKFDYVKLARSLPTFGTHFFLVRVSDGFGNTCVKVFEFVLFRNPKIENWSLSFSE